MATTNLLNPFEILWFKTSSHQRNTCQIKNFIHFLHYIGHKRPFLFSVTEESGQLIENLTLIENLFLEWGEKKFKGTSTEGPLAILKKIGNPFLFDLYELIPNWDVYPKEVDAETRKLASLFKTFLQDCEYYFFDHPTRHLNEQAKSIFTRALQNQANLSSKLIFIHAEESEELKKIATKVILRGPNHEFQIRELEHPKNNSATHTLATMPAKAGPLPINLSEYWPSNSPLTSPNEEEIDIKTVDSHLKFSQAS